MLAEDAVVDRAEDAFAAGDALLARTLLHEALAAADDTALALRVHVDLAVVATVLGEPLVAERHLLAALALDRAHLPALEDLAGWCEQRGDLVQATHWWRRAEAVDPAREEPRAALERVLAARRVPGAAAPPPAPAAAPPAARGARRVLVVVDFFAPMVGGSERLAEAAALALRAEGLVVEVATRRLAERTALDHRGLRVHELDGDVQAGLERVVAEGGFDALLVFSAPTTWPLIATLRLARPRPRLVVVPCVNREGAGALRARPGLLEHYRELVAGAEVIGFSSLSGEDVRLCDELGLPGVHVPNAVDAVAPARGFRTVYRIDDGAPLLLAVGNLWPEKDHAGLLRALRHHPGDWRLAIAGGPSPLAPEVAEEVAALAAADERVTLTGPLAPELVAAAMVEASVLLLPSRAEATPLVLLEAMSHALPWVATPACGAAHDHAGGFVLPLDTFPEAIDHLLRHPGEHAALGAAGRAHWKAAYTWTVMGRRYARLVRGESVTDVLLPPGQAAEATEAARAAFYDARPA